MSAVRRFPLAGACVAAALLAGIASWLLRPCDDVAHDAARSTRVAPSPATAPIALTGFAPSKAAGSPVPGVEQAAPVVRAPFDEASRLPLLVAGRVIDAEGRPVAAARGSVFRLTPPEAPTESVADQNGLKVVWERGAAAADPLSLLLDGSMARLRSPLGQEFVGRDPVNLDLQVRVLERRLSAVSFEMSGGRTLTSGVFAVATELQFAGEPWAVRPVYNASPDEEDTALFATTDEEGRFALYAEAPEGESALRASSLCCFSPTRVPFEAGSDDVVVRVECWAALVARPVEDGRPLADADVRVRVVEPSGRASRAQSYCSNPTGGLLADGLAPGTAAVEIFVDGGCTPVVRFDDVRLTAGERSADPRLNPVELGGLVRRVRIRVTDVHGRPVSGARVRKAPSQTQCETAASAPVPSSFFGCGNARVLTTGADGAASLHVRRGGEDVEISADGYIGARTTAYGGETVVALRRYRVADLSWTTPPAFEAAAAGFAEIAPWWDVIAAFAPHGGASGWNAVFNGEPNPLYCESAGTLRFELRIHASIEGAPFDLFEAVPWIAEVEVRDVDDPQTFRLRPPSEADLASVMPRLVQRVASFRERAAAEEERKAAAARDG
jgi:hypothetical protein